MLGKRVIKFERLKIRSNFKTGFRRLGHIYGMQRYNIYATLQSIKHYNTYSSTIHNITVHITLQT